MSLLDKLNHEFLMIKIFVEIYCIDNIVKKMYKRFFNDDIVTKESIKVTYNEVNIYILLDNYLRIIKFLYTNFTKIYIEFKYYFNDNLKNFIKKYKLCIEVYKY